LTICLQFVYVEEENDTIKKSERAIGAIGSLGVLGVFGFGLWFGAVFLGVGVSFVSAVVGLLFYTFLRRKTRKVVLNTKRLL